ncbi:MAG: glycosyltransferase [Clostridiales bacterium]|nr:glycosyltransferase [Clostridiales bacterium]
MNECLDSCLDQQLSKDEYEIICVDDGSTDRTPEILKEYSERFANIRIVTKRHGTQYGYGRTIGLSHAAGDYVWFVDHDDIVAPGAVDDLLQIVLQNPGIDRVGFHCYEFFDMLTTEEKSAMGARTLVFNDDDFYKSSVTWSSILRIAFLKENDILPHSKRIREAAMFWGIDDFRIWSGDTIFMDECYDKGIRSIRIPGRPLYHYRRHENTETMSKSPEMVQLRRSGMLNTGLYWGYLAYMQKQRYIDERKLNGKATQETADKTILKVDRAVKYILKLPPKQWRNAFKRFKEKDIFFKHMPEEYQQSFKEYWKLRTKRERVFPATVSSYFVMTKKGEQWTRLLTMPNRIIARSVIYQKHNLKKVAARRRAIGLGRK